MSFESNTGQTIQEAFEEYHAKHPEIYGHFKRLAFQAISRGRKKISSEMIINVIRWDVFINTSDTDMIIGNERKSFKINQNYKSRYARLFVREYPEYACKFELRELKAN